MPRLPLSRAVVMGVVSTLVIVTGRAVAHGPGDSHPHRAPADTLVVTSTVRVGSPEMTYESVANWCQLPEGQTALGSTHGGVVIDKAGLIYFSLDKGEHGILVYAPDGKLVRGMAPKFRGIHAMVIREEAGEEFIYAAHLAGKQVVKLRLDGTPVWTIGVPAESGKYPDPKRYSPTAIAVGLNNHVYVADGYGQNWVHQFDENQKYVRSFGGGGSEPGQFKTCHGIALDTRGDKPLLLVCDRENRRLQHFDLDGNFVAVITEGLRRPCAVSIHGDLVAVAELEGRVTILGADNKPIAHLGDNPDKKQRANFGVPPGQWKNGVFTAPHGLSFDKDHNLYVMDWNASGRVSRLNRVTVD